MRRAIIFTTAFAAVVFTSASATIINIPDDQPNIQAGIAASSDDDSVRVAPGTYVENIDFSGKNIVVGSWFLDAGDPSYISSTIIDGNQSGSVVTFENGEDNTAIITGFTIQNGVVLEGFGGGIYCDNSSPTISNNTISGNYADYYGGGIYCDNSSPMIYHNTISGNSTFFQNGGGISCIYSSPTITNNNIIGNSARDGGGIFCWDSSPAISNNTISGNSAVNRGGGIRCWDSSPVITNTIFWSNSAPNGPEIQVSGTPPVITYSDIQGGWGGEGNIACDPQFCYPDTGNYYLHSHSCCVGAGQGGVDIGAFGVGCGDIINIPDDYETIQEGIDASFSGDTVRVASGTYVENIDFSGKNIVLRSWFLDDGDTSFISSTIIDGNQSGSVVTFVNGEDNTAIITGFTIQNGLATDGGGIYCRDNSSPTIIYNTISGNSADRGGGIRLTLNSDAIITSNTINGNSADGGAGIHCTANSNPMIEYNIINGNSAEQWGGGLYCSLNNPTISNNTISGNSVYWSGGGGICCWESSPVITNTILWGNSAPFDPEISLHAISSPVITYSDVQGGWEGEGNIDCDPMFCNPENDNFYLNAASCCVGAGEGGVDIGASGVGCGYIINIPVDYETIQEGIDASSNGDTVRVASGTYVENIDFNGKNIVVGSWFLDAGDPSYISSTIIDGNQSGSVVSFLNGEDNSAVITGFTIQNGHATYGGGIRCNSSSPTINYNTISGNSVIQTGAGIDCQYSSATISKNTISGNSAGSGAGIGCHDSSPTINYNTISGNSASFEGAGIVCWDSSPTINYNTISGNSADYNGGGIFCWNSIPVITNTILWGNSAPDGPEIYSYGGPPVITYCDIQGGWGGEGNIDCDPMFCDPDNGDLYLANASCCVGAGEGGVDIGAFGIGCGLPVPTLSEWGMMIMGLLLLVLGTAAVVRKKRAVLAKSAEIG